MGITYYEPNLNQLNRTAKRADLRGCNPGNNNFFDFIFSRNNKIKPALQSEKLRHKLFELINRTKKNINWSANLFETRYIAFDIETTGICPFEGDEIISLGAVVIEKRTILDKPYFYELVNPKHPVSEPSKKITGLTNDMLNDKREIGPVLLDFLKFCGSGTLIAHNASFDISFMNVKLGASIGERIINPVIDTALLASALYYSLGDYSLESLAPRFNLSLKGRHNALCDARIAASLYLTLLPELKNRDITTLSELADFLSDSDLTKGYPRTL